MASPTQWTWVWVDSGSWWWTGRPGVMWFMRSQRVRHDWAPEVNWTDHLASSSCLRTHPSKSLPTWPPGRTEAQSPKAWHGSWGSGGAKALLPSGLTFMSCKDCGNSLVHSLSPVLHIRCSNYWSISISPSHKYSGLISFRMDWLDLLAVQGILKSLLQHHSSKASILWRSAFLIVLLSHPYMTIGKTIAFTRWTFVGKVMSLLFNMLYFQGESALLFHGCSDHLQWFWGPSKKSSLPLFLLFPHLFAMKWWDQMPWS